MNTYKKPVVSVKVGYMIVPASNYNVVYSNNTNTGTAAVTVTANKYVWYCFAVLGAVVVMLIVYLKSRKQEKQEIENLTKDDKINTDKTNDDNSNIINIDPTKL